MERFLSQPFFVAEQFTGTPGQYVPIAESIRGFKEILEGKHDDVPERAFFMKGSIDEVVAEAGGAKDDDSDSNSDSDSDEEKSEDQGAQEPSDSEEDAGSEDDGGTEAG
jgi:hypothetical protein